MSDTHFEEMTAPVEEPGKPFWHEVLDVARILIIALAIVLPIRFFVAQPFIVRGASMEPNFQDGEYLIVDELSYQLHPPARGDVVILRYPKDPREFFIKRLVGKPGETVMIKDGHVYIEETPESAPVELKEPYLLGDIFTGPNSVVKLGQGEYFVLGDNRTKSSDSRSWGVLKQDFLIGRAFLRLWPLTQATLL